MLIKFFRLSKGEIKAMEPKRNEIQIRPKWGWVDFYL